MVDQNTNESKSHIWNSLFENIISVSGIQLFCIHPHVSLNIIRVFLIFYFSAESLKANKDWRKRSLILQYNFAQKTSLILQTLTHLTLKTICYHNTAKNFLTLQIFQPTNFTNFTNFLYISVYIR